MNIVTAAIRLQMNKCFKILIPPHHMPSNDNKKTNDNEKRIDIIH